MTVLDLLVCLIEELGLDFGIVGGIILVVAQSHGDAGESLR